MHELSLAQRIVEIVYEGIGQSDPAEVRTVSLAVGELANVHGDSLLFAFEALVDGTPLRHASLRIEHVPLEVRCRTCGRNSFVDKFVFACTQCESTSLDVLRGHELDVTSIEIVDHTKV